MIPKSGNRFSEKIMLKGESGDRRGLPMVGPNRRQLLIASALAPVAGSLARAASYPERPIRIIIPYAAGGVAETVTRLLAVGMERKLGQKLVIEAKPGA